MDAHERHLIIGKQSFGLISPTGIIDPTQTYTMLRQNWPTSSPATNSNTRCVTNNNMARSDKRADDGCYTVA